MHQEKNQEITEPHLMLYHQGPGMVLDNMDWKVYLVRCADNSLYCGITNDLNGRIEKHNTGKGAKYTQSRLPVALVAASRGLSKSAALRLEHYIKQQPARKKVEMLQKSV
jgi:putative endonuclease